MPLSVRLGLQSIAPLSRCAAAALLPLGVAATSCGTPENGTAPAPPRESFGAQAQRVEATGAESKAEALLAATPPMGWNSWNRFGCNISESLIRETADALVTSGMKAAGYTYINLDDCWQVSRDAQGVIQADPQRFPSGIKVLADYVHSKGLKLGIYSDRGTMTCEKRPGSEGYEELDATTYASWGVDYLKYDNCHAKLDMETQYTKMSQALRNSGRSMVFSICAWEFKPWMPKVGHLWRTTGDIKDTWTSMLSNMDQQAELYRYAGPGHWNDPDMLEVGNGGMTDIEYRSHMSLWAIMAAPLIAGNDLRTMNEATRAILTAPEVIAVDQDPLGVQGRRVRNNLWGHEVWTKTLKTPGQRAVALFNRGDRDAEIRVRFDEVGLKAGPTLVRDLWERRDLGSFKAEFSAKVAPHATVLVRIEGEEARP